MWNWKDLRALLTAISGHCGLLLGAPLGPLKEQRMQHSAGCLLWMATVMFELSVGRRVKRLAGAQRRDIRLCLDQVFSRCAGLLYTSFAFTTIRRHFETGTEG